MSLFSTTLSVDLEIKDRLETGREFFMTSLSSEGFLSKGVTSAAFIFVDTIPVDMEKFTMFVILGRRQYKCSFKKPGRHRIE